MHSMLMQFTVSNPNQTKFHFPHNVALKIKKIIRSCSSVEDIKKSYPELSVSLICSSFNSSRFSTPFTVGVFMRTPDALPEMLAKVGLRTFSSSIMGSGCMKSTLHFFVTIRSESEDTLFIRTWVRGRVARAGVGAGAGAGAVAGAGAGVGDGEWGNAGGSGSISRPGGKTSEEGLSDRSPLHLGV